MNKSWRKSLFVGWRWVLFILVSVILFIPIFLFGLFFPLILLSFFLVFLLVFFKSKFNRSQKIGILLILTFISFVSNIALILVLSPEVYLVFSFLITSFLLLLFYFLIGMLKFYFSKYPNKVNYSANQSIEIYNSNDNLQDIIEVSDIKVGSIPKNPEYIDSKNITNNQLKHNINNPDFNHINKNLINLSDENIFYLNSLQLPYKRSILNYEFFEIETVKLYIEICGKTDEILRIKGFSLKQRIKEMSQEYFRYSDTLYSLFCISEFTISNYYFPHKKDTNPSFSFRLLNEQLGFEISNELKKFIENNIRYLPEIPKELYYTLNKSAWKNDLKTLLESNLNLVILKQKCDELLELNSQNTSQYLIYLELCKQFAKKSKTASLWYYYKYYELLTFKNFQALNLPEPKPLPTSIVKIIFGKDQEKLKQFEIICKTRNPLKHSDETKKEEIKNLFKVQRKELKLDLSETKKAQETHKQMTAKLNQVLQEDELLDALKNPKKELSNPQISKIQKKEKTQTKTSQTNNFTDFFATSTNSDSQIDFTEIESQFIAFFKENNFKLSDSLVSKFAKDKKQFKNSLIKKINQKFYQIQEENLIEEDGENYLISNHNQKLI